MIINPEIMPNNKKYKCNKVIAKWLIYNKHLPVFSVQGEYYFFIRTAQFEDAIKELPFYLKVTELF